MKTEDDPLLSSKPKVYTELRTVSMECNTVFIISIQPLG
jgi:hypothetical protein